MGLFPDIFTEIAALLLWAVGVGALCMRLRQPLVQSTIGFEQSAARAQVPLVRLMVEDF